MASDFGPLQGITVLELGSSVAGPFCGRLLADFGARVIKVETPSGDPLRNMSVRAGGHSLYAASILRNKQLVSIDLHKASGRALAAALSRKVDVIVENFRPSVLARWQLDYATLAAGNPGLVMVHISGFGQTGPYRARAGYGAIGGAMGGLRHLTGEPDRPPSRSNASVVDEVTGLYGALGAMMALHARERTGLGQEVDCALYEAAFSLIEPHVPAYGMLGVVAQREGSQLPGSAPNNQYLTRDSRYIHITAMGDAVFRRLATLMGRPELADDPRYGSQQERSGREAELDTLIAAWVAGFDAAELEARLHEAGVPTSRVYDMRDIFADAHYRARDMLVQMPDPDLGTVTVPGVVPKLSRTPGRVCFAGRRVGQDTRAVLESMLGLDGPTIAALQAEGAIHIGAAAAAS